MKAYKTIDYIINTLTLLMVCLAIGSLTAFEGGVAFSAAFLQTLCFAICACGLAAFQKKRVANRRASRHRMRALHAANAAAAYTGEKRALQVKRGGYTAA